MPKKTNPDLNKAEVELSQAESNLNRYTGALQNLQRYYGLGVMIKEDAEHLALLIGKLTLAIWQLQAGIAAINKRIKELTPEEKKTDENNSDKGNKN